MHKVRLSRRGIVLKSPLGTGFSSYQIPPSILSHCRRDPSCQICIELEVTPQRRIDTSHFWLKFCSQALYRFPPHVTVSVPFSRPCLANYSCQDLCRPRGAEVDNHFSQGFSCMVTLLTGMIFLLPVPYSHSIITRECMCTRLYSPMVKLSIDSSRQRVLYEVIRLVFFTTTILVVLVSRCAVIHAKM
ncbi:hypothetical protein H4582DRAFT_716964 [Lactarius indigo]|nr:hypothetical protein H4582DRAFT_716964 [Lactarius indigo]